jgi:hypothetical protein
MTYNDVLGELLAHLRTENKAIRISWDSIQQWPDGALKAFLKLGLLKSAPAAQSLECQECENRCFMDVLTLPNDNPAFTRAFIVCEDADMQADMGRINVPMDRLRQWQSSPKQLAKVLAGLLGLNDAFSVSGDPIVFKLGMLQSNKGRRWIVLNGADLSIEINQHALPVNEVLYFDGETLLIDQRRIDDLINSAPLNTGKKYTPSTTKREAGKLETQAMYQDWKDEYARIKQKHPTKSDSWIAGQIANKAIAKGKDAETIRKNMK